jgi:hypothetical protein
MPGIIDKIQEVLTAVGRLSDLEKRQSATIAELRDEIRSIRLWTHKVDSQPERFVIQGPRRGSHHGSRSILAG